MSDRTGKSVSQLHADRLAEIKFADMMASAGVAHNRMAVELLFFVPGGFKDAYIRMFRKALKGDDSDVDAAGKRNDSVGVLGKAAGKNDAGGTSASYESQTGGRTDGEGAMGPSRRIPGSVEQRRTEFAPGQTASVSGRGKKFKKYWTIEDERAFQLKELIDRRLRGMAREIESQLDIWEAQDEELSGRTKQRKETWEDSKGRSDAEIYQAYQNELESKRDR